MSGGRSAFNRQETERHIEQVFLFFYSQGGIQAVSTSRLCRDAGIARSTFYLYFEDKYTVLEKIESELLLALKKMHSGVTFHDMDVFKKEGVLPSLQQMAVHLEKNIHAYQALLGQHGDPSFIQRWKRDISERFRFLKDDTRKTEISSWIFAAGLVELYSSFLFENPRLTEKELSCSVHKLLRLMVFDF